jgi:hypothetical protein
MLRQAIAAVLLSVAFAAVASAQVIYEPVQSQYRTAAGETFYYAGDNPRVFEYARQRLDCFPGNRGPRVGRNDYAFLRGRLNEPPQYTFSDCAPYRNAIVFGYTSVDARNEAYANVPRFFRMADLLASAVPARDGAGVVVPAQAAGTIDIRPSRPAASPATLPGTRPTPVMIIPKKALEGPVNTGQIVTLAQ